MNNPKISQGTLLKDYSNFKIGGRADYFAEVESSSDLAQLISDWKGKIFILGSGTNILFNDDGFRGLVILSKIGGFRLDNGLLKVGSGVLLSEVLDFCIENSLSGLEWAGGLPGTVGGAVRGNAGAFGEETKDVVSKVTSVSLLSFSQVSRTRGELNFSYRNSVFKSGEGKDEFIEDVWFDLKKGDRGQIGKKIQEKIDYRKERHPIDLPNIGSTFKNIPKEKVPQSLIDEYNLPIKDDPFPIIPTAKILSLAGLKGKRVGDAQVSEKHPNFIVNLGNAKASEVLALIKIEKEAVGEKFGLSLEEEILIL